MQLGTLTIAGGGCSYSMHKQFTCICQLTALSNLKLFSYSCITINNKIEPKFVIVYYA